MKKLTKNTFLFSLIATLCIGTFTILQVTKKKTPNSKEQINNEVMSFEDAIKHDVKMKNVGDTCEIKATVLPANASNKKLNWSLSEGYENYLSYTVSEDTNTITIKKLATFASYYTLTATSLDNKNVSASCKIYSYNDIKSLSFMKITCEDEPSSPTLLQAYRNYRIYMKVEATSDNSRTLDLAYADYDCSVSSAFENILIVQKAGGELGGTYIYSVSHNGEYIELVLAVVTFNKTNFDAKGVDTLDGSIIINNVECKMTIGAYVKVTSIGLLESYTV